MVILNTCNRCLKQSFILDKVISSLKCSAGDGNQMCLIINSRISVIWNCGKWVSEIFQSSKRTKKLKKNHEHGVRNWENIIISDQVFADQQINTV